MKVNMTPNPLDVVTIHASQGDTEARQWEFELHNNGELIDTSDVKEQLVFKAYKGGTEQLLPENTSTPTTSPFLGDIKYPQGLLTDQEFTYRQSPTEEDGLAKIADIKGNTIVWNQLIQNGNFDAIGNWTRRYRGSISVANNILTYINDTGGTLNNWQTEVRTPSFSIPANHVFYCQFDMKSENYPGASYHIAESPSGNVGITFNPTSVPQNVWTKMTFLGSLDREITNLSIRMIGVSNENGATTQIKNFMLFDLTQMGLDITDPSEFASIFNLPYYAYNQGSLLSFMGNGIKTVGKNLLNYDAWKTVETRNGTSVWENNGVTITATGNDAYTLYGASTFPVNARIPVRVGETITLSWESDDNVNGDVYIFPNGGSVGFVQTNNRYNKSLSYTPVDGVEYVTIRFGVASSGNIIHFKNIMLRFADTDSTFEPYTSSALSLPISTYFPNGMNSAGSVYDELTESKAITRVGMVDLGSLTWTYMPNNYFRSSAVISDAKTPQNEDTVANILCSKLKANTANYVYANNEGIAIDGTGRIRIYYANMPTDATAFKTAMNGVMLYYELATPTETSFTTASLVTENAEIPLSNEDGTLIGKCTEELSSQPGFIDAKIKLTDGDGTCYSNKLQLHVERKP